MVDVMGTGGFGGQGRTIVDRILIQGEDRTRAAYASAARNAENAAKRMQQAFQRSVQQRLTSRGALGPGAQAAAISGAPAAQQRNAANRISHLVGEMRNLSRLSEAGKLTPEHLTTVRGMAKGYSKSGADMGPHMTKFMAAFERHLGQWAGNLRNSAMAAEQLENASRNAADALKGIRTAKSEADKEKLAKQYLQSANILKQHDKAVGKDTTELLQHASAVEKGLGGAGKKFHPFTPIHTWHGAGTLSAIERASSAMQGFSATMNVFSGNLEQLVYAPFFLRFSELSTFFAAAGIGGITALAGGLVKAGNAAKETTLRMEAMVHSEEDRNRILEESYRIAIRTGDSWDRVRLAMADMHAKNIQFHDETFEILLDFAKARPGVELEQILAIFQKAANITPARIEQLHQIGFKVGKDDKGLYDLSLGANTVSGIDRSDQQQLLEAMTTLAKMQHGGFAERFGFTTLAGQMGHLSNAAGDLARVLGRDLDASLSGLLRPFVFLADRVRELAMAFEQGDRRARFIVSILSSLVKIGMVLGAMVFGRVLLGGIRSTTAAIAAQIIPANVLAGSLHNLGSASARAGVMQARMGLAFGGLSILFGILGEQTGWAIFRWLEFASIAAIVVSALVPYTAWMKAASFATGIFGKVSAIVALRGVTGLMIGFRALAASLLSSFALGGPIMWALFGVGAALAFVAISRNMDRLTSSLQGAGSQASNTARDFGTFSSVLEDSGKTFDSFAGFLEDFRSNWNKTGTEINYTKDAVQAFLDLWDKVKELVDKILSLRVTISWPWGDTEGGVKAWGLRKAVEIVTAVGSPTIPLGIGLGAGALGKVVEALDKAATGRTVTYTLTTHDGSLTTTGNALDKVAEGRGVTYTLTTHDGSLTATGNALDKAAEGRTVTYNLTTHDGSLVETVAALDRAALGRTVTYDLTTHDGSLTETVAALDKAALERTVTYNLTTHAGSLADVEKALNHAARDRTSTVTITENRVRGSGSGKGTSTPAKKPPPPVGTDDDPEFGDLGWSSSNGQGSNGVSGKKVDPLATDTLNTLAAEQPAATSTTTPVNTFQQALEDAAHQYHQQSEQIQAMFEHHYGDQAQTIWAQEHATAMQDLEPQLARGGIVPSRAGGGLYRLGEGGKKEVVQPLTPALKALAEGKMMGGDIHVTMNFPNMITADRQALREVAEMVSEALSDTFRSRVQGYTL